MGLSFFASIMTTAVLQLVVQPWIADNYTKADNGEILFITGIINVLILTFGNSLGDIKLTKNASFEKGEKQPDYNVFLLIAVSLAAILTLPTFFARIEITVWDAIVLIIFAILGTMHSYMLAILRMRLMFVDSVITSAIRCVGYVVAIPLVMLTEVWAMPFAVSYLFSVTYLLIRTRTLGEGFGFGRNAKAIGKSYGQLSFSYALKSSLTYVDRFMIYPFVGNEEVAIYSVATVLGKCVALVLQPMANVVLGYYAQPGYVMSRKKYWLINLFAVALGNVAFICVWLFSGIFIKLLYPSYVEAVQPYIIVANIAAILGALPSIIQPALLRYCGMKWQIIIQAIYASSTVILSLVLIHFFSLMGFCFAILIANLLKLVIMMIIGDVGIRRQPANTLVEPSA